MRYQLMEVRGGRVSLFAHSSMLGHLLPELDYLFECAPASYVQDTKLDKRIELKDAIALFRQPMPN